MKKMKTFYIRHPEFPSAVQFLTQDNVTVDEVLFDCQVILGDIQPTEIAEGQPDNVVWHA